MAGPVNLQAPASYRSCGQHNRARHVRHKRQLRAPFSGGSSISCSTKKNKQPSIPKPAVSNLFAGKPVHALVQAPHGTLQAVYSVSTYRDEGALSEISIADYLSESPRRSSKADTKAGPAHTKLVVSSTSENPTARSEGTLAEETARRRQQRSCYPASHVNKCNSQALQHSNFLERRPKVQLPSRLQGCVTEVVPCTSSTPGDNKLLDGEAQLVLWSQYAAAQKAIALDQALHSQLGRRPASSQLAAALSLPSAAALARLLADGQSAKLQLVAANFGLVQKLAHDYKQKNEVPFQDLVQAGLLGLDRGLCKYDPTRGAKLSTALYWYIRDAIFKTYRLEKHAIHIPLTTQEQMDKLRKAAKQHQQQYPDQRPSLEYLLKATGLGRQAVQRVLQVTALSEYSLDVLAGHAGANSQAEGDHKADSLMDRLAGSDEEAERSQGLHLLHLDLEALLTALPDPHRVIMQEKYGLLDGHAKTFEEVSTVLHIKRWKVQEYHRIAMKSLRTSDSLAHLAHAL